MVLTHTHRRSDWLQGAYWEPGSPVWPGWSAIRLFVVHWPGHDGAIDGDPGEYEHQLDDFLRSMQSNYVRNRGYNVGYNSAGDWLGGTWELRGETFKCAANAGLNDIAYAHTVLTDLDGKITQFAIDAVNRLYWQAKAVQPLIKLIGHGEGPALYPERNPTRTGCPGPLQLLVNDGTFTKSRDTTPPPPPPPDPVGGVYVVVSGDGWISIARKLGHTSPWPVLEANRPLHPGEVLMIPGSTGKYKVVSGDGWLSIARKLNQWSPWPILELNRPLHPGEILRVPGDTKVQHPDPETIDIPPATLAPGSTDAVRIRWLQVILGVPVTSAYDAATVEAVKQVQRNLRIFVDGIYGPQTVTALRAWRTSVGLPRSA